MSKEKQTNFNFNYKNNNSGEEVPFITISNSKSSSSKNQNSKNSKSSSNINKISLTQYNNSSSNSIKYNENSSSSKKNKKIFPNLNQEENPGGIFTFTQNSDYHPLYETSFDKEEQGYKNKSLSEDKKEVNTDMKTNIKPENQTPKKAYDKTAVLFEKFKNKKKAVLTIDNIPGKNLMDYFEKICVNVETENKNKKRVSSVENVPNINFRLKKDIVNINKSWNKNIYPSFNILKKSIKKVDKDNNINNNKNNSNINNKGVKNNINIKKENNLKVFSSIKKKKSTSCLSNSAIKNFENIFKKNNINFEDLLNKYMPTKPKKIIEKKNNNNNVINNFQKTFIKKNSNNTFINSINNYLCQKTKINTEKKINPERIRKTPKSDSYKRKLSSSSLKVKEIAIKNLFHDFKPKQNEIEIINKNIRDNKKKLSAKVVSKINNPIEELKNKQQNILGKIFNNNINNINAFIKKKYFKKESFENKINIKKINNYNENNPYFIKYKEKKEFPKQNEKNNKGYNYKINSNIKK